tara:strand:- start:12431 stop:12784 length:354 start_codon:yes stop_codon:yes gene_type:complete
MIDFEKIIKYSEEYDEAMNVELEIVKNAYGSALPYSIKLPNKMTGMSLVEFGDTTQPRWDALDEETGYGNMLKKYDVYYDSGFADYPVYGNTARIFYRDLDKAQGALYYLKKVPTNY